MFFSFERDRSGMSESQAIVVENRLHIKKQRVLQLAEQAIFR